jgi:hypothetical protein
MAFWVVAIQQEQILSLCYPYCGAQQEQNRVSGNDITEDPSGDRLISFMM